MKILGSNRGEILAKMVKIKLDKREDPEEVLRWLEEKGRRIGLIDERLSELIKNLKDQ